MFSFNCWKRKERRQKFSKIDLKKAFKAQDYTIKASKNHFQPPTISKHSRQNYCAITRTSLKNQDTSENHHENKKQQPLKRQKENHPPNQHK